MIRSVKAHPGVFIGGMVTYALLTHLVLPELKARGVTSGKSKAK